MDNIICLSAKRRKTYKKCTVAINHIAVKYFSSVLLIALLALISTAAHAQYTYHHIDNSSGLSNSCINSIYQDADNIIWFGTWDGLNFYDGNSIHVFNYENSAHKNSLASNVIYQVTGDHNRNIWVGTVEGVSRFNKNTGDFSNYFYPKDKVVSNGYMVAVDKKGIVYAARRNNPDLYRYDNKRDQFKKVGIQGLQNFESLKILFDDNDNLWLLRDNGILEAFTKTKNGFLSLKQFNAVKEVDNVFFVNKQLFYTTKTGELFVVKQNYATKKLLTLPHEVRSISFFKHHYIFAWASKGIGGYDTTFKPFSTIQNQIPVLKNVRVTSLINGTANLLWVGTDGNGVMKVAKKENDFGIVQSEPDGNSFHIPVRAFSEINRKLWVGTKGNGIITIKNLGTKNISFSRINSFHTDVDLLDNCVYVIKKSKNGLAYIGSDAAGITLYDLNKKKFIKWGDIKNSGSYPAFSSVHCILFDKDGSTWLGLNESGLVHLKLTKNPAGDIEIQYLHQYRYTGSNTGPGNDVIYTLAEGNDNNLWIGCRYGGLSLFNKKTKTFKTFKAGTYKGSLSNNDVLSLYIDQRNRLWVGTSFGINWINETTAANSSKPIFNKLTAENGLPNNTIHAIDEDGHGNIWISTNKGLAKINPNNLKIYQYKESDGLQSDEFSDNAVWKDPSGMLFFGGIYGFNYFLPENIHITNEIPHLLLSDLQFAGKNATERGLKVLTKNDAGINQHYNLKPQDNSFELDIQPITFLHSQKCQFAYLLQGSDDNWHYVGNHGKIIYNNIPPGNYTLKIKWSNGEGKWTKGVTAFSVKVKQYFWLTPIAFAIYVFILLLSAYLYIRYRKNKFLMKQKLRMEHLLREKEEALHQEQLTFFTNIAHELQTPLTLILGALERYLYKDKHTGKDKNNNHFLSIVKQEASRLYYLIHQLLEFRKAESGRLQNHYRYLNISELLTARADLFKPLEEEKNVNFSSHIDPDIYLWADTDKLEKIIFNLLSNAFKHCGHNEDIIFSVHTQDDKLQIVAANSGCKLKAEEVDRLFERFFVIDGSQQNKLTSGIGLAFTKQLINLLNGQISVKCEHHWISFKVLLPLNFIPDKKFQSNDPAEKADNASYIFGAITNYQKNIIKPSIADNNKYSLIKSFEEAGKKSILIVEDEQLIRYLLKDILNETYIIYEASTGKEALEVINCSMPDLIISDIMMPDMDGLALCNLIKNTSASCHIPFVILSARTSMEQMTEGYGCGADAYIPKPFQTEHLLVRIQKLLKYRDKLHQLFKNNQLSIPLADNDLNESDKYFIEKVTKIIEENLDEELDIPFLENALNLSRIQLYRKIKTLSNMTPTELIRQIRLQKASILLLNSDLTVSEIFYRTGFNNKTYFFREFKKLYNCSPNEYRNKNRLPDLKH